MDTIETLMDNPDWEADQFVFLRIQKEEDGFRATLYLDLGKDRDLYTCGEITADSISAALRSLEDSLDMEIANGASQQFLEKALEQEKEELEA